MAILVTGCAGFIGYSVALKLLAHEKVVIGIDNLNDYYDPQLKKDRLAILQKNSLFSFFLLDISNKTTLEKFFLKNKIEIVIHLAAQVGVRYSVINPHAYAESNLSGFINLIELSQQHNVQHFIFASSSSVYGENTKAPFCESDNTDRPRSLYGATKKANELIAYAYAHLHKLPTTALRFFTVYGPWGRPDMAVFSFTNHIFLKKPIIVYNNGNMLRDFTYIDDITESIFRMLTKLPNAADTPFQVFNLGNGQAILLNYFISLLEKEIGEKAIIEYAPMQRADVHATHADVTALEKVIGKLLHTPIEIGVARFIWWYKQYYKLGALHHT